MHDDGIDIGETKCEELLGYLNRLDTASIKAVDWRDFESRCAEVLAENGYKVLGSIWFRGPDRRYQIDVVGVLLNRVICIDCKAWTTGGGSSRSKRAVESQKERTLRLKRCVSVRGLAGPEDMDFYPLIVTLRSEDVTLHDGVAVVPFEMFNTFLVEFDSYEDRLFKI